MLCLISCQSKDILIDVRSFDTKNCIAFDEMGDISAFGRTRVFLYIGLIKTEESAKPLKLTSGRYNEECPRWSGDGEKLYFLRAEEGSLPEALYLLDFTDGSIAKVIDKKRKFSVRSYSIQRENKGNDTIFFVDGNLGIIYKWDFESLIPITTTDTLREALDSIENYEFCDIKEMDISSKHNLLALSCNLKHTKIKPCMRGSAIIIFDIKNRKCVKIFCDTLAKVASDIAFDPEGKFLAFTNHKSKTQHEIILWDPAVDTSTTVLETSDLAWIGWAPDGNRIAYAGAKPGMPPQTESKTIVIDLQGNVLMELNFSGEFDWSPK